jgi:hypothetical protein
MITTSDLGEGKATMGKTKKTVEIRWELLRGPKTASKKRGRSRGPQERRGSGVGRVAAPQAPRAQGVRHVRPARLAPSPGGDAVRRFIDREDAADAGLEEADVLRLEEIFREAGMARMSAEDIERQAERVLEWARAVARNRAY